LAGFVPGAFFAAFLAAFLAGAAFLAAFLAGAAFFTEVALVATVLAADRFFAGEAAAFGGDSLPLTRGACRSIFVPSCTHWQHLPGSAAIW